MTESRQLDLFADNGFAATPAAPEAAEPPLPPPETLSDEALLAAIQEATQRTCRALTREASRRCLPAAIPALVSLARRFRGFGLHSPIAEQRAALRALAAIGGPEAASAVIALLADGTIQGPGLADAIEVAAHLQARLPPAVALPLLRDPDPWVRAGAAACARVNAEVAAALRDLLEDLNADVATQAAHALGRAGYPEALTPLFRTLAEHPTPETIDAITPIADEQTVVLLGRLARTHPDLAEAARAALADIDHPRAAAVLKGLTKQPP